MTDAHKQAAAALTAALEDLDPRLGCCFVTAGADPAWGVVPGRWHVVRRNEPPTPDSYTAITTESGGYREPDFGVLAEMHKRDMWKHGAPPEPEPQGPAKPIAGAKDMVAEDVRAAWRLPGEGGMTKKLWAKK